MPISTKNGNDAYVYAYLDPRKPGIYCYGLCKFFFEPFYIGKGHGNRKFFHLTRAFYEKDREFKTYKYNKIRKILKEFGSPLIVSIKENMGDTEALDYEKLLIHVIGRLDKNQGTLLNYTDGGDGTSGRKATPEQSAKLSKIRKGKKLSEKAKTLISMKLKGRVFSKAHKNNLAKSRKNIKYSLKTRLKIGSKHTGRKMKLESLENMRSKLMGHAVSEATKKKISNGNRKRKNKMYQSTYNKNSKIVEKIKELLKGNKKIGDVAKILKIAHSTLSTIFKEVTGVTPDYYRRTGLTQSPSKEILKRKERSLYRRHLMGET